MIITAETESIRVRPVTTRADPELVRDLAAFPVALIGDCLQRIGLMHHEIRPMTSHAAMAGTVYPVLCREGDNLAIHRALDEAQRGDVLVINGFGELNRALFGSVLGEACVTLGIAGVVLDGSVRDVGDLDRLGLPTFARGVTPAGPFKSGPGAIGEAVACGGVVCHPGDAIIGDGDGLIVLRADELAALPALLEAQTAVEDRMRSRIASLTPA